jgi:hypothetical protein
MSQNWRAPERVGQQIGLSDEELSSFLSIVREVHQEQRGIEAYDLSRDYFHFLNDEVFSHPRVVEYLQELNFTEDTVATFREGDVDIENAFDTSYKFHYRLDQIVDFVLLIKLVRDYLEYAETDYIEPIDRLHYLVYLTNNELKETPVQSARRQRTDLGSLEFTGYRYTFRKKEDGLHSQRLSRDKDRLLAWTLFEKKVSDEYDPNQYTPFELQLGRSGEMITMRYESRFDGLRKAQSDLLREWAISQRDVIERFADMPIDELKTHVTSMNEFSTTPDGRVLLTGRPRFFDPEEGDVLSTIAGGMQIA